MKIIILTEGGRKVGFGHIARCTALYDVFRKYGATALLLIRGDKSVKGLLKGRKSKVFDWLEGRDKLSGLLKGADIVIIDSYLADRDLYVKISKIAKAAVYMDDNKRLRYPGGIVVNSSIYAGKLKYPGYKGVAYLLGAEYLPLRKEFWYSAKKKTRKKVENIMVTFGGNDLRGMTKNVLKLLTLYYPTVKKTVIIGAGFKNKGKIRKAGDGNTLFVYNPDTAKIKAVMMNSDLAISAGGQTLYELARIGVPTVAVAIAENQFNNINGWIKSGFIEYAGWHCDKNILINIKRSIDKLLSYRTRVSKSRIGRRAVDGGGADRICSNVINYMSMQQITK